MGYEVILAEGGQESLGKLESVQPDLILLDVMMPDMDGFETCEHMRKKGYDGKIVIYTAKIDGVDVGKARQVGADDFTVKTSGLEHITESIGKLLTQ